ncbi:glycerophosphodiester phosphodiesterase family protein [Sphingomonas sp. 10B4]|uniref:glycerophosphodiester phosphodiesterase family protein n=1 Tax=Sphingomonas sp. 10B4 TaxID=3048575 RepID=UPI002AB3DF68|nr:glycerophosphodiester phosphodiesterase family protein [Sphingomonas sp. 10B4]MDY7522836.1 glycerophosphodiester phosphodiesterase family protein [Sphingomonas sp. 10B4]MEB0284264.1 glycerophosphodiester phosphodiesterase family protein [Sphingomonas sp. 10B4]
MSSAALLVSLLLSVAAPVPASQQRLATTRQVLADPQSKRLIVVAHRGCWHQAPENSVAGLDACVRAGVDAIELDVRHTRDGVAVIIHDETLDRTTNGRGAVADHDWVELSRLRLRTGHGGPDATLTDHSIPTLDAYLAAAKGRMMIVFDVKDGSQRDTFRHIERAGMADQAIFFYECVDRTIADAIAPFRNRVTTFPIMFGKDGPLAPAAARCASTPPGWAHIKWSDPTWLNDAARAHARTGLRLWTATMFPADNAGLDDARALRDPDAVWGAQIRAGAGMIMTNQPEALLAYRDLSAK